MHNRLYVALGDSTAAGIGARIGGGYPERVAGLLRERRPGLRVLNLGESGATSSDVLRRQVPRVVAARPAVVSLAIGINDVGLQVPDDAFAVNLEEIAVRLARLGAPVAIANLPDLALSPAVLRLVPRAFYEQRLEVYNRHVEATAARHGFALIDLWEISRETLPGHPEFFSPDGFHPSAAGYDAWAARVAPLIDPLLDAAEPDAREDASTP